MYGKYKMDFEIKKYAKNFKVLISVESLFLYRILFIIFHRNCKEKDFHIKSLFENL